jgi:hypothetical protein
MSYFAPSIRVRISSTFQTVVRGPSFTDFGNRPDFTPTHQVERPTGIGPCGARIEVSRTKPLAEMARALLYNFVCSIEFFHFNPIRRRDGVAGDLSLEIVAAAARERTAPNRARTNPRESRIAARLCDSFFAERRDPVESNPHQHVPRCDWLSKAADAFVPSFLHRASKCA